MARKPHVLGSLIHCSHQLLCFCIAYSFIRWRLRWDLTPWTVSVQPVFLLEMVDMGRFFPMDVIAMTEVIWFEKHGWETLLEWSAINPPWIVWWVYDTLKISQDPRGTCSIFLSENNFPCSVKLLCISRLIFPENFISYLKEKIMANIKTAVEVILGQL